MHLEDKREYYFTLKNIFLKERVNMNLNYNKTKNQVY